MSEGIFGCPLIICWEVIMKYFKKISVTMCVMMYTIFMTGTVNVFAEGEGEAAADASSVVQPIFTIINLFVTAMQAVGAFLFVKSLSELATSLRRDDDVGAASAAKGMLAGLILISIRLLLSLCGVPLS